jgi:ribonucleotide reductase alpha subunit
MSEMRVTKRDGELKVVEFDKILHRLRVLGNEANLKINYTSLAMKVIDQLYDGISTTKIDELSAEQCASMSSTNLDYNVLAGRIVVSNHQKNTTASFSEVMSALYNFKDKAGKHSPLVSDALYELTQTHSVTLDAMCDYSRDYDIDYFGFKTLERAYLMKIDGKSVERPQHMWLRVAIGIHEKNLNRIRETYDYMSRKYFTHATPTLFNAGTPHPQLSSCFLEAMESDSVDGIYNTLKDCALISKWAGGIGLHIHNVRASGSHIRGTNGNSNGIVPMLKVFNNTAKYIDQCVHPETIIYTTHGPKQIQHCSVGETAIYNLKGGTEVIKDVLEHPYEGETLEIATLHSLFPLQITPEHPVYTLRGQKKGTNYSMITNRLEKKHVDFEWTDAKDLTVDDMLVYPIPKWDCDVSAISANDCYMYGVILGDGYMEDTNGHLSLHTTDKLHIREFAEDYFKTKLVDYKVTTDENTTRVRWNYTIHLPFRRNDVYDENKTKRVHHKWLNLPLEKSKYILKGLLDTDGCNGEKELVFDSTSLNLIESVRFLCMKMGALTSGYIRDRVGEKHETASGRMIENKKIAYCLRIPRTPEICELLSMDYNDNQFFKFFRYGDFLMSRIQSITPATYSGILYDLQMTEQHDYLIHNGLVHNGGGRRNGSFAIYLEPWHADVELFLQMRKNHGDEELKARDLFYAMWIPDLFMERVKVNGKWTLMCPDECPGLADVYGDDFAALYTKYETEGKGRRSVNARDVWFQILDAQMETGTPYILFKDACNKKSNQKNLGTIKSSNLCVAPETLILTDKGHMTIQDLEGHKVNVWNGEEFSEVTVVKTGTGQELVDVFTDDGAKVTCTPYHKFYIMKDTIKMVTAEELRPGDELLQCSSYPVIDGTDAYCGESIPSHNCPIQTKLEWFNNYCEAEGNTTNGIASSDGKFLRHLQLFLQTCGIGSVINTLTSRAKTSVTLHNLDSSLHRLVLTKRPIKILKVEHNNRFDDTYCFTEPKRHMGVFNGILTGQCTEIIQYSDENETAVCNLASIALPPFIKADGTFDYEELHKVTKIVTYNLNRVIDVNYYPIPKTRTSNFRNRPVGLGIQGLSDCFAIMNIAFHSDAAKDINKKVFETMYHAALEQSCDLAVTDGPYDTFQGSPASQGILQFDMWNVDPGSSRYDWAALKERIKVNGLRNSLLLAPMPTASTSQILGYNECIEPFTSNIYSRRTLAGEFIMTNKYLMKDLNALGLWNDKLKNSIIANNGSVQQIESIPQEIRDKYKTVWEIPMKHLIDMSADRGAFICQSQSLNLWLEDPNYNMLTSMHFYSWSKGLKTGIYYLRRRARHHAQKFTIEPEKKQHTEQAEENHECEMCGA